MKLSLFAGNFFSRQADSEQFHWIPAQRSDPSRSKPSSRPIPRGSGQTPESRWEALRRA